MHRQRFLGERCEHAEHALEQVAFWNLGHMFDLVRMERSLLCEACTAHVTPVWLLRLHACATCGMLTESALHAETLPTVVTFEWFFASV